MQLMTDDNSQINIGQIRQKINKGDYNSALVLAYAALKKRPKDGQLNYLLAFCLQQLKTDLKKSLHHYNLALEYGFLEFWVRYNRSLLYLSLTNVEAASTDLERAICLNPNHSGAKQFMEKLKIFEVNHLVNQSRFHEALPKLKELLRNNPHSGAVHYLFAYCFHNSRTDWTKALNHYDLALKHGYDEFWVRYNRSLLYLSLTNVEVEKARLDLQRAVDLNPEHEGAQRLLRELERSAVSKPGRFNADDFCIIDGNLEEAVRMVNTRRFDDAVVRLEKLLKTRPNSGAVHYLFAYCLHSSKIDYTQALKHYHLAFNYGYDEFWLLYARGSLYFTLKEFGKARIDLRRAANLNHDHKMTQNISKIMEETEIVEAEELIYKGSLGDALYRLKALLAANPRAGRVHYFTGLCLNLKTEYNKALEHYNLALEYGFDEFRVRRSRSYLHRALNNFEDAIADLERARTIDPHDQGARDALEQLQRLSSTLSSTGHGDNQITVLSPVLVNSVPKSGTMLLYNILISILGDRIVLPATILDVEPFRTQYLKRQQKIPNRVYWGHVSYSDDLAHLLSSIPKIILVRDPRDNVVSLAHFLNNTLLTQCTRTEYEEYWNRRTKEEKLSGVIFGMDIPSYYVNPLMDFFLKHAIKWASEPKTLFVRYEDIVGSQFGGSDAKVVSTIKSVMDFIGIRNLDENTLAKKIMVGAEPGRSTTFRSGGIGSWRQEFGSSHVKQLKTAAPGLVSSLGYEPDENWEIKRTTESPVRRTEFPQIDKTNLTALASKNISLDWNTYLELRKDFMGDTRSNNQHALDEWALNLFNDSGQIENALFILENHLGISVSNNPRRNYYYAFYLHILRKDLQKALRHYDIALKNGFDQFWVRYNRGILLRELGYLDNAYVDLKQAALLNPHFEAVHTLLKELEMERIASKPPLCELEKVKKLISNLEFNDGIIQLTELLKVFPTDAELNYLYGFCLQSLQKDLKEALYRYNIALKNGFDEFWIRYNRGILLFYLGDVQESIADLERAISLKPGHNGALEILGYVRNELNRTLTS